jgi:hypothetical protein
METKKFEICIVDDKLPFIKEVDDSHLIESKAIQRVAFENDGWGEEINLFNLTSLLLQSDLFKSAKIDIHWAMNPNILLNAVKDENYLPDLIIYDWEYGTSFMVPEDTLSELLKALKDAFFFIYSYFAQKIPIHLFRRNLDKNANRFQILRKGDNSYITNSEEIIFDYVALRVEKNPVIKIGGLDVQFNSSGFLTSYKDILYLDGLLGREAFLRALLNLNKTLSNETVLNMLGNLNLTLYSDAGGLIMTLDNIKSNQKIFGELKVVSNSVAFQKLGLEGLRELIDKGTVKVK